MARRHLVQAHFEGISWRVFRDYRSTLREMIRGQPGVYALYKGSRLYYVGLASNLMRRLNAHLRDRHRGQWDRFSVYLTSDSSHIRELEALVLRIVDPAGNKQKGKLAGAENLYSSLNDRVKELDDERRAQLLGGRVARQRRRRVAKSSSPKGVLAGQRRPLKGYRLGYEYSATLLKSGQISYAGKRYEKPSEAAKAATKAKRINAWTFWHFRDRNGEWVKLRELKR